MLLRPLLRPARRLVGPAFAPNGGSRARPLRQEPAGPRRSEARPGQAAHGRRRGLLQRSRRATSARRRIASSRRRTTSRARSNALKGMAHLRAGARARRRGDQPATTSSSRRRGDSSIRPTRPRSRPISRRSRAPSCGSRCAPTNPASQSSTRARLRAASRSRTATRSASTGTKLGIHPGMHTFTATAEGRPRSHVDGRARERRQARARLRVRQGQARHGRGFSPDDPSAARRTPEDKPSGPCPSRVRLRRAHSRAAASAARSWAACSRRGREERLRRSERQVRPPRALERLRIDKVVTLQPRRGRLASASTSGRRGDDARSSS